MCCVTVDKTLPFSGLFAHQQNEEVTSVTSRIVLKGPSFFCAPFFFPADSVSQAIHSGPHAPGS